MTPLVVGLGAVTRKPWVRGNAVQLRDILHLSLLLDHDVVDGAHFQSPERRRRPP
jgi:pyruvate/2-oxoglutarate dehydrogenase complex dihydrolipoamide acyltransferase (E2) component